MLANRETGRDRIFALTEKGEVGRGRADELDEGLPELLAEAHPRADDVGEREEGEEQADPADLEELEDQVHLSEPGETLVPDRGQQLLDVRVGHELE